MEADINKPVDIKLNTEKMVEDWAVIVLDKWFKALSTYNIGVTGSLMRSFSKQLESANGDVDAVIFKFLNYGRFDDMGVGRGQSLNGLVENRKFDRYRDAEGKMAGKLSRKKKPWYTKTFYREVAKLTAIYQEQGSDQLLQIMENALNLNINIPT